VSGKRSPNVPARQRAAPSLTVVWTNRALSDLEAIGDYIARDNERAAQRWVLRLIAVAQKAALVPLTGRRVPELGQDDIREVFLRTYRLVYRVAKNRFEVLTVFEGHRLFPDDVDLTEGER
jgi:toxin ParE1/3/4